MERDLDWDSGVADLVTSLPTCARSGVRASRRGESRGRIRSREQKGLIGDLYVASAEMATGITRLKTLPRCLTG